MGLFPLALLLAAAGVGCKKSGGGAGDGADGAADGATDGSTEHGPAACPALDAGEPDDAGDSLITADDFGPNAPAGKAASSLGRVNIFEVTTPSVLERVDIYLRADLDHTRLTVAVQEATSRTTPFQKVIEVQMDIGTCAGWITSGELGISLHAGHFYAIGYDPNQVVMPFVSTDSDVLPIDGAFGRLIGSRTATSVSVDSLTWDKFLDKEYNRQRIWTSPSADDGDSDGGISIVPVGPADAGTSDAGTSDASGDKGAADAGTTGDVKSGG